MNTEDCLFCGIAGGTVPSHKVFEDDEFVVILDRFPSIAGHLLVMPKDHADDALGTEEAKAGRLYQLAVKTAKAAKTALKADGINILTNIGAAAGQTVMHTHIHVIPRFAGDTVAIRWKAQNPEDGELEKAAALIKPLLNQGD